MHGPEKPFLIFIFTKKIRIILAFVIEVIYNIYANMNDMEK